MPRIRTIKPEFWADEKLAPMRPIERLVFLGLISMADDAGRLVDSIKAIDGFVFPMTEDSSKASIESLNRLGRIVRYKSESGQHLIQITNWKTHQKVVNPSSYVLPAPKLRQHKIESIESLNKSSASDLLPTTNDLLPTTLDLGPTTNDQEIPSESSADVRDAKSTNHESPLLLIFPTNGNPKSWELRESFRCEMQELFPQLDVMVEFRKALAWVKTKRRKTSRGMPAFLSSWLSRANDGSKGKGSRNGCGDYDPVARGQSYDPESQGRPTGFE